MKGSVKIANVPTEIQTENLMDKSTAFPLDQSAEWNMSHRTSTQMTNSSSTVDSMHSNHIKKKKKLALHAMWIKFSKWSWVFVRKGLKIWCFIKRIQIWNP
jgi:hypothetical protein